MKNKMILRIQRVMINFRRELRIICRIYLKENTMNKFLGRWGLKIFIFIWINFKLRILVFLSNKFRFRMNKIIIIRNRVREGMKMRYYFVKQILNIVLRGRLEMKLLKFFLSTRYSILLIIIRITLMCVYLMYSINI